MFRELGDLTGIAGCLHSLAQTAIREGELSQASQWLKELKQIHNQFQKSGLREGSLLNRRLMFLIVNEPFYYWQGDYNEAIAHCEEIINISKTLGYPPYWHLTHLAYAQLGNGDISQAKENFHLSAKNFQKAGNLYGLVFVAEGLAKLNINQEQIKLATRLLAWAGKMRHEINYHRWSIEQNSVDKDLEIIHSQLDDDEFARLSEEGHAMTTEQAIALALDEKHE